MSWEENEVRGNERAKHQMAFEKRSFVDKWLLLLV